MIDAGKGRQQNLRHCVVRAVVGMHVPADIGEDAARVAESRFSGRFAEDAIREDRRCPFEELVAVLRKAREAARQIAAAGKQGVFGLFLFVEAVEQDAFAQTIGGDDNFLRPQRRDQLVENQRPERKGFDAALRNIGYLRQRFRSEALDHAGNVGSITRGDHILMEDMDRIITLCHMDAGEVSPDAAHGIEALALKILEPVLLTEGAVDDGFRLRKTAMREVDQAEGSERQRCTGAGLTPRDGHEFQTAPAKIADQPVGFRDAGQDTLS